MTAPDVVVPLDTVWHVFIGTVPMLVLLFGAYLRVRSRLDTIEANMFAQREAVASTRGELMARIASIDGKKVDISACAGVHAALASAIEALRADMRSLDEALRAFALALPRKENNRP